MLFLDEDAAFAAIKSGKVDVSEVDISYANQSVEGYKLKSLHASIAQGLSFPMENDTGKKGKKGEKIGNNVTADPAIRKALNVGLDRNKIVKDTIYGHGTPEYTGIDQRPYPEAKIKDGDIEKAKQILKEGGWKDTDGDGILEKNGQKAEIDLYYRSDEPDRQVLSQVVSELGKELGIKFNLKGSTSDQEKTVQESSCILYQQRDINPYASVYKQYHTEDPSDYDYLNPGLYGNPHVDEILNKALTSNTQEEANKYWKQAAYDGTTGFGPNGDAPWLWIVTTDYTYMVKNSVDIGKIKGSTGLDILQNIEDWKRV